MRNRFAQGLSLAKPYVTLDSFDCSHIYVSAKLNTDSPQKSRSVIIIIVSIIDIFRVAKTIKTIARTTVLDGDND